MRVRENYGTGPLGIGYGARTDEQLARDAELTVLGLEFDSGEPNPFALRVHYERPLEDPTGGRDIACQPLLLCPHEPQYLGLRTVMDYTGVASTAWGRNNEIQARVALLRERTIVYLSEQFVSAAHASVYYRFTYFRSILFESCKIANELGSL